MAGFLNLPLGRFTLLLCLIIYSNKGANLESETDLQYTKSSVLFFELAFWIDKEKTLDLKDADIQRTFSFVKKTKSIH